jgi:hypothetical protein
MGIRLRRRDMAMCNSFNVERLCGEAQLSCGWCSQAEFTLSRHFRFASDPGHSNLMRGLDRHRPQALGDA